MNLISAPPAIQGNEDALQQIKDEIKQIADMNDQEAVVLAAQDLIGRAEKAAGDHRPITNEMIASVCADHKLSGGIAEKTCAILAKVAFFSTSAALSKFLAELREVFVNERFCF